MFYNHNRALQKIRHIRSASWCLDYVTRVTLTILHNTIAHCGVACPLRLPVLFCCCCVVYCTLTTSVMGSERGKRPRQVVCWTFGKPESYIRNGTADSGFRRFTLGRTARTENERKRKKWFLIDVESDFNVIKSNCGLKVSMENE